jgi:hypothetical protein
VKLLANSKIEKTPVDWMSKYWIAQGKINVGYHQGYKQYRFGGNNQFHHQFIFHLVG